MTRKVTSINMQMIRDGYSIGEAMVYSRLRWLSHHVDGADIIYPSQSRMAQDLCLSERQIIRCLQKLEDTGLIEMDHRGYKRRNNYYVVDSNKYPCFIEN